MVKKIDKVDVSGETIYLRKTFIGWGVVHPIKIDGKFNWKNFIAGGSWIKLFILAFVIALLVLCIYDYGNALRVANECIELLKQKPSFINPFS